MTIRVLKMDLIEVDFGEKLKALKFSNWETLAKLEAISNQYTKSMHNCISLCHYIENFIYWEIPITL